MRELKSRLKTLENECELLKLELQSRLVVFPSCVRGAVVGLRRNAEK